MDESYIAAYGSRGALLDLDTVKDNLDLSAMDAKVLDTGKVDGTLVGAPIGTANFSVAVNPKVLKEAGVKMPDDKTWTWDDLANTSAEGHRQARRQGRVRPRRFRHRRSRAGRLGTAAGRRGLADRRAEPGQRCHGHQLLRLRRQADPDQSHPRSHRFRWRIPPRRLDASLFATNKAAFHLLFHTQISAFATASGNEMQLLRLPAQKTGESPKMVNKASMYWSISARSKQRRGGGEAGRLPDDRSGRDQDPQNGARHPRDPHGAEGDRPAAGSAVQDRP